MRTLAKAPQMTWPVSLPLGPLLQVKGPRAPLLVNFFSSLWCAERHESWNQLDAPTGTVHFPQGHCYPTQGTCRNHKIFGPFEKGQTTRCKSTAALRRSSMMMSFWDRIKMFLLVTTPANWAHKILLSTMTAFAVDFRSWQTSSTHNS